MNKYIRKFYAWEWKCPFCKETGIEYNEEDANDTYKGHISFCELNPENHYCKTCGKWKMNKIRVMGNCNYFCKLTAFNDTCNKWEDS